MQVGCNIEVEVAHRVLRFTLVESSYPHIAQALLHGGTQHRSARPAEAFGQVVQFLHCRRVKAGIHADAWLKPAYGFMLWTPSALATISPSLAILPVHHLAPRADCS
jgi:hypothetical protein